MTRAYLGLAIVGFLAYSVVPPLLKVAMVTIPSTTAVVLSNLVMLALLTGLILHQRTHPARYLTHHTTRYILAWGVLLAIGLLAYYRALELGPVSIVVPIFGLFIAISAIIGIFAFDEPITARKLAALVFAVAAIILMSL